MSWPGPILTGLMTRHPSKPTRSLAWILPASNGCGASFGEIASHALCGHGFREAIFHGGAMLTDEQIRTFTDLLQQHGVPPKAVQDRIYQLLQKLTSETVAQALQTRWPWTKLKQLATEKGTRLVLQEELEQHIQTRKTKGPGSRQTKRAKPAEPITSLPLQLFELPENHFQDDKQQPLPVLSPDQVKHAATGVALMTADQVEPLLSHPHSRLNLLQSSLTMWTLRASRPTMISAPSSWP